MRQAIEQILHTAGHNAKWYESAEAVVDMEAAMTADCLILDIELPGMSGLELYRTLKRSGLQPQQFLSPRTTGTTCVTKPNDWEQRIT